MDHYERKLLEDSAKAQAKQAEATVRVANALERIANILERMCPADSASEQPILHHDRPD